jgi:hypothetical protein
MKSKIIKNFAVAAAFAVTALIAQSANAATTVLDFEGFPDQTVLGTQYQSLGVTISGAMVQLTTGTFFVPHSGVNVAYAPSGLMTLSFDPILAANVQSVSVYLTGLPGTGLYAYDVLNNLIGQALLPTGALANTLLTVNSAAGVPIISVEIHDGGSTFFIDDFTFVTGSSCSQLAANLYSTINGIALTEFVNQKAAAAEKRGLLLFVSEIEKMVAQGKKRPVIKDELLGLRKVVNLVLVNDSVKSSVLAAIDGVVGQIATCK